MVDRMKDKVVVVAGAGSIAPGWGNGKACAVLYAREGATLYLIDRDKAAVEETARLVAEEGAKVHAEAGDLTNDDTVGRLLQDCVDRFGRIDVMHNNVGGSHPGTVEEMDVTTWDAQMDHNLKTVYLGCHHAIPHMRKGGGGAIINVASVAGYRHIGTPIHAYAAAKAGVVQLSRAIGVTYAKEKIRCNTVVPGLMHTPLVEARLVSQRGNNDAEALIAKRHAQVPMGHMGDAWDIAYAALYLASDEAKYVTATEIVVDGGLVMSAPV
ncbi:SDR family NAD(P)-dependent oxidoreductase [Thalassobaculum sp. OXR-137]|uniref:SDR family NAD(P)-dependent oxidoreductase n=1 Tax=Thalassobaculum sp. OXR-137 TaxID=3100173 RepID=UPI002AC988E7|nr:SDR family NAD(P)-dependent oxidoreductase [Thalassobaculum sp. OXR-137]WPZ37014.1 SDR family NAD(P)-dependent oxidoreductase [Thalassobaculum sp. OXR-137]